jgi:hypothetical protein
MKYYLLRKNNNKTAHTTKKEKPFETEKFLTLTANEG